jgi:hypothetical protein
MVEVVSPMSASAIEASVDSGEPFVVAVRLELTVAAAGRD